MQMFTVDEVFFITKENKVKLYESLWVQTFQGNEENKWKALNLVLPGLE